MDTQHTSQAASDVADAWFNRGLQAHQQADFAGAEQAYRQALAHAPQHVGALHLLGVLAAQAQRLDHAIDLMARAASLAPTDFSILNNLGNALVRAKKFDEALTCLDASAKLNAVAPQVQNNRGNALNGLSRFDEALAAYEEALRLAPEYAEAWANKATTLNKLQRHQDALLCGQRAVELSPQSALAHNAKGMALYGLRKWTESNACFVEALRLRPDYADALHNRGLVYFNNRRWAQAEPLLLEAARLEPANGEYQTALADNYYGAKRYPEALATIEQAEASGVELENAAYTRTMLASAICDWRHRDGDLERLRSVASRIPTPPFTVLGVIDDPALQMETARCWVNHRYLMSPMAGLPPLHIPQRGSKIKVGYFSADFHDHATMYLMAEFFELHDRSQFEVIAFSFRPPMDDAMGRRARAAFDRWEDVSDRSDQEIVDLARRIKLDIAVDLKGFTGEGRPGIFLQRAAPVQVNYLGYPGSFGEPVMDYVLADRHLIHPDEYDSYAEKIVRLPHTYQVNDRKRARPMLTLERSAYGLPRNDFVFCCFNNNYKITPEIFEVWMRLLNAVSGSVLWLLEDTEAAAANLRREAKARGVDAARLIFAPRVSAEAHLERMVLADLFLDTCPYNAHTTASEALWMGVPIVTLRGRSFASRVASSLLHAVDLPQLVTTNLQDYETLAFKLATDRLLLDPLRRHLRAQGPKTALFDTPRLTKDIERAYRMMLERCLQGQAPDHMDVPEREASTAHP